MSLFFKRFSLITSSFLCATLTASAFSVNGITYKEIKGKYKNCQKVIVTGINEYYNSEVNIRIPRYISYNGRTYFVNEISNSVLQKVKSWGSRIFLEVDNEQNNAPVDNDN